MNQVEVLNALAREPARTDNGVLCQICGREFENITRLAVHQVPERREVGLAPPSRPLSEVKRLPKDIVCGYDGCQVRVRRTSLPSHLRGRTTHQLTLTEASFYAHQRQGEILAELNGNGHKPAVIEPEPVEAEIVTESVLTDLEAVEAVTGILSAARTDRLIPTALLPQVVNLINHTEAVLGELRTLTEGGNHDQRPKPGHRARRPR